MNQHFDQIYCLTLKETPDRAKGAIEQLEKVGCTEFQFFNGATPDDEEVKDAFRKGLVQGYPSCFRCGRTSCSCDNNFLTTNQVACFVSYMRLFYMASNHPTKKTFLLVEDDVEFEDYAVDALELALGERARHRTGIDTNIPSLLSLGQNYVGRAPKMSRTFDGNVNWVENDASECNVMFAFNKAFAELAVHQFKGYFTTSDVYIHRYLHDKCLHHTIHPRIAHDLSWSTGEVKSTIHPKSNYITHPDRSDEEIKEEIGRMRSYIKRVDTEEEYNKYVEEYLGT